MAIYSRKSSSNRGKQIKWVPKKDVIPIQESEDSNRCGNESEIGKKSAEEKGKQAKVVISCADPYEIFRMSMSDDDSEWKSRMKSAKSKDITPSKENSEVAVRDLQIDIQDENAIVKNVETDQDGGTPALHNKTIHVETALETESDSKHTELVRNLIDRAEKISDARKDIQTPNQRSISK